MTLESLQPAAERRWATSDKVLHRLSRANPIPAEPPLAGADGFAALVQSITHQQVSLAAGQTIHGRVVRLLGGKVTPRRVLNRSPEEFRAAGLSRGKSAYVLDLADKTLRGDVGFARFPAMPDEAIVEELTAVKGIGTWTSKMFLLFHLHRPDVWCPEDLGLRIAVANAYKVPEARAAKVMEERRAAWSPYNSVAARVLWQSRRSDKP